MTLQPRWPGWRSRTPKTDERRGQAQGGRAPRPRTAKTRRNGLPLRVAARSALVAAYAWRLGVAGVPVRDGPQLVSGTDAEAVAVGYTGDQNEDVVTGAASPEGLAVLPETGAS